MKKLVLVIMLTLMTTQAHAFGWFLLGLAVGSSGKTTTDSTAYNSLSPRYLDVYNRPCYYERRGSDTAKTKAMINSGLIIRFYEPEKDDLPKKCTEVYTHEGSYHINAPYAEVMKKLFEGQK